MKKITTLIIILSAFTINTFAQKISKQEAQVLLDKAFTSLKNSDTTSFLNLWLFDNMNDPAEEKPFTIKDAKTTFTEIKVFLDTALVNNMRIDEVEITDMNKQFGATYKIKAYYKYNAKTHYIKAVGYRIDYINKKWVFRFHPEYTSGYRTSDK